MRVKQDTKIFEGRTLWLDGFAIPQSASVKNLGVLFDPQLCFDQHIRSITRIAFFHLRNIARIRPMLSAADAETLIHAFVSSRLDYCNALFSGLPNSTTKSLQLVERLPIEPPSYGIGCHQRSGKLTLWSYSKESSKRTSIILHLECENDRCEVKTTLFACAFLITLYIPTMYFSVLIHYSVCSSVLRVLDWMPGLSSWITGQNPITILI